MSGLIPTREEWGKLRFEGWKWLLIVVLGAVGAAVVAFVPTVRSWCVMAAHAVSAFAGSDVAVRGWRLIVLAAFAVVGLLAVMRWVARQLGPKYVRCFREGEYDNVIWRWKWKRGAVDQPSMKPFCSKCGTGLVASHNQGAMITVGIVTKTRVDTHMYCPTCNTTAVFTNVEKLWDLVRLKIEGDASRGTWNVPQGRVPEGLRRR